MGRYDHFGLGAGAAAKDPPVALAPSGPGQEFENAVLGWMNSEPHRARGICGEWWSSAGVAVAVSDEETVYAVIGFC